MLVLTMQEGGKIIVEHEGQVCEVTVWLSKGRIKVGFNAPKEFTVVREEVLNKKVDENGKYVKKGS